MKNTITLEALEGKWYILWSNFPMWLKGDKTSPTFNYKVATKNGIKGLTDNVEYLQNGIVKSIKGFDKPLNENNTSFEWRGNGLLSLLSSKWQILYFDNDENWAIIYFEKTLFTPTGYDIIAREKNLGEAALKNIKNKLKELKITENLQKI
jgi:lipocalin